MSVTSALRQDVSAPPARPSFARVAEENLDVVHRYLAHLVRDAHLAEDLTSATFERAMRDWRRFDPGRGRVSVWLVEIARRVALDHFRREGRRRAREERYAAEQPSSDPGPDPGQPPEDGIDESLELTYPASDPPRPVRIHPDSDTGAGRPPQR